MVTPAQREPRSWTIPLPGYTTPPLSLNHRLHWRAEARIKADLVDIGIVYSRKLAIPALDRFAAVLHYAPRQNRTRDTENIAPTVKPVVDGFCRARGIPDDRAHYFPQPPVIHDATGEPGRLWVVITELVGAP